MKKLSTNRNNIASIAIIENYSYANTSPINTERNTQNLPKGTKINEGILL